MKQIVTFCIIALTIFGCAVERGRLKKRAKELNTLWSQKKNSKKVVSPQKTEKPQKEKWILPSGVFSSTGKILLPSIIHPSDQSEMVLITAGEYLVGNMGFHNKDPDSAHHPVHLKTFPAFYMDRKEVSVDQYKKFDPSYNEKPFAKNKECPACPAMRIDWEHARRYCLWAGKRLPDEEEWEAAARGSSSDPWPWGSESLPNNANLFGDNDGFAQAAPVGSFPLGASPHGVLDMIGNVWEWVDAKPKKGSPTPSRRVVKGGGWSSSLEKATISFRNLVDPKLKNPVFGFRCMKPSRGETDIRLPSS